MKQPKKRDKKYRPKPIRLRTEASPREIKAIDDVLDKQNLIATLKLHNGTAIDNDIRCLLELNRWAAYSVSKRSKHLDDQPVCEFLLLLKLSQDALVNSIERFRSGKSNVYAFTADEIKTIIDATAEAVFYLKERARNCPNQFLSEWDFIEKSRLINRKPNYRQKLDYTPAPPIEDENKEKKK